MIKELFPNIFQINVPLPYDPLGHLNSYLIKSVDKNLLIDTGLDFSQAFQSLCAGLSGAQVRPEELTEILVTHFHVDHIGLIPSFRETSGKIQLSIHRIEAELSKLIASEFEDHKESMMTFPEANGMPSSTATKIERFHSAFFTPQAYKELAISAFSLQDGQEISAGDYRFQVVWTPGHSPGHVCLYEPSLKILFSGDHLLPTISPHVAQFMENTDPLSDYMKSLEKTERLDIDVVLPAHEETFTNHRERIAQFKDHHERRLSEITDVINNGSMTAYTIASKVHWNVNYQSWNEFPLFQKYLALGETVAHLNLLEQKGLVRKRRADRLIFYEIGGA